MLVTAKMFAWIFALGACSEAQISKDNAINSPPPSYRE